jgi:putative inorganic carbon (HCO3(-)) transporter
MFEVSFNWILIKIFAISGFIFILIAQRPIKVAPQHILSFCLLPAIVLSGFINSSGSQGIDQAIMFLSSALIPLFMISSAVSTPKRQHLLMAICFITMICMVHNGHIQQDNYYGWALGTHYVEEGRITYLGIFGDPNDVGMFLVMILPFIAYFFFNYSKAIKLLMIILLAINIYGISITGSEGTVLGACGLLGAYYVFIRHGTKLFFTLVALMPVVMMAFLKLLISVDISAYDRLYAWYDGILMLLSSPILGIGKGRFADVHGGLTAHNSYILVASELGTIGYSLWGAALLITLIMGYKFIKAIPKEELADLTNDQKKALAINKALFFSLIGYLITAFFLSRSYIVLLYIFIGMSIASHFYIMKELPEIKARITTKLVFQCMLYCWGLIIAVYMALKVAL